MWRVYVHRHPTLGRWVASIERQPSWMTRAAIITAALVVVLPIVVLVLAAVIAGALVFGILWLVLAILTLPVRIISRISARRQDDGRKNVRVIEHFD